MHFDENQLVAVKRLGQWDDQGTRGVACGALDGESPVCCLGHSAHRGTLHFARGGPQSALSGVDQADALALWSESTSGSEMIGSVG